MTSFTVSQLRAGHETLPQEMYDQIFDLVFAYEDDPLMVIDETYRPPVQLQINRATRREFVKRYYGKEIPWWVALKNYNPPAVSSDGCLRLEAFAQRPPGSNGLFRRPSVNQAGHLLNFWFRSLPEDSLIALSKRESRNKPTWALTEERYRVGWTTGPGSRFGRDHDVHEIVEIISRKEYRKKLKRI